MGDWRSDLKRFQDKANERVLRIAKGIEYIALVFGFAFLLARFTIIGMESNDNVWAYAQANETDESHVVIQPRPVNCDVDAAPLGTKGCHYKKHVDVIPPQNGVPKEVFVFYERIEGE